MQKLLFTQFFILMAGTIFAWSNFTIEMIDFLNQRACTLGCSAGTLTNPFLTPCFYGAMVFTLSFILSTIILKKEKK